MLNEGISGRNPYYMIEEGTITQFDTTQFFDFPYLVEINLSNTNLWDLPLSISNCVLLERINISHNPMSRPPAILFSLPKLRANPHNIIFGNDQICTKRLAQNIIDECASLNHTMINLKDIDGSKRVVTCPPQTTTLSFLQMVHPELMFTDYIALVRTCNFDGKDYVLRIIPEKVPISLYFYPGAVWSFELKFLPPSNPIQIFPLLKNYVAEQYNKYKNDDPLLKQLNDQMQQTKEGDPNILSELNQSRYLSSRVFKAKLPNSKEIEISLNARNASVIFSKTSYYTFSNRSISFSYANDNAGYICLLVCDEKAIIIEHKSVKDLMTLFSYSTPEMDLRTKRGPSAASKKDFLSLITTSVPSCLFWNSNMSSIFTSKPQIINEEKELEDLRKFKGRKLRFVNINNVLKSESYSTFKRSQTELVAKRPK
ncbi:hypothetical protein M9Y10_008899 [Tritrichomonas musculus]|uniref:Leucine Rich Repeat family protein n=1 Tax=Tritrichomonas musculus TaxID=1915356 RepID=A0ABR2J0C2_9EUKA